MIQKGLPSKSPPQLRSKPIEQPIRNYSDENDSNLLDLTGSPLKDSCQFEALSESIAEELASKRIAWKNDEEQYQSIPMDESQ